MGKRTRKHPAPRAYHDGLIPTTHETYHTYPEVVPDDYDQVKHEKSYPELAPVQHDDHHQQLDHQLDPVQLQLAQEHHLQHRQRSPSQTGPGVHVPSLLSGDIPHPPPTSATSHETLPLNRAITNNTTTTATGPTATTSGNTNTNTTSPLTAPPLVHSAHPSSHAFTSIPRTSGVHSLRQAWSELDEEEENEHRRQRLRQQRRHQNRRKGLRGHGVNGSGTDEEYDDDEYDSDDFEGGDDDYDEGERAERGAGLTEEERQKRREKRVRRRRREKRLRGLGLGGLVSLVGGSGPSGKGEKSRKGKGKGTPVWWKRGLVWVVVVLVVIVVALAGVLGAVLSGKIRTAAMDGSSTPPPPSPTLVTDPVCDSNTTQKQNTYTSPATTTPKTFRIQCNADYPGGDGELGLQTNTLDINTMADCLDACARRSDCVGAVFRPKGTATMNSGTDSSSEGGSGSGKTDTAACWLKATVGVVRTGEAAVGMVSGVLVQ